MEGDLLVCISRLFSSAENVAQCEAAMQGSSLSSWVAIFYLLFWQQQNKYISTHEKAKRS
jgi:hypothetical protein